ncbi:hypothetical protein K9O30_04645 [Clostridium bowmanii]|uniref:hypothetical protein n=1 Tax=Clostridium bowmanii TaxID=132925 RepID=UPI001C0B59B1|nr:hypothetical protein [Clostridium bowmanii]MBU3189146.1 hypothetical protein [Clostridium bowmanii]MCA1073032.1 hypothetical protein [Clostridium bowmanii]
MYKTRQLKIILAFLLMIMGILSFKLISVKDKFFLNKNQNDYSIKVDGNIKNIEKYGYSDILEILRKNMNFDVKSINMLEHEKCNVQVDYIGDIKLLYNSLNSLKENKNFSGINSININKDVNTINISIDFKKNK